MTYPETIQYLESFINYEKIPEYPYKESLKLERFKDFLKLIRNPENKLKCIHVAGTKGKGSTCAFIAYILRQAGFKVGLYTSPHLSDFRERIRILSCQLSAVSCQLQKDFEGIISKRELTDLVNKNKPAIEKYNQSSKYGPLSFFEVYTALAFIYFKEKKTDFVVLETGLGGRLDATNVVKPLVCAITPISYEHTQKLGNTLRKIAAEKAGIIKSGNQQIVVSAPQEKEAEKVIVERCKETGAKLKKINRYAYLDFKIKLLGEHQLINANVAVGVIKALGLHGIRIKKEAIKKGLLNTLWPGRCEVIARHPLIVLDGAQNIASACALKKTIKQDFRYKRLILILGVSKDKDISGICNQFYNLADKIILTQVSSPRAAQAEVLAGHFKNKFTYITSNIKEAKEKAIELAGKNDLILVSGSLFVAGEFRALFKATG
ncbi:MAG: folylpolyglutamate synthase/dihydrofolate synthase family protein [Candidatus Omnitrophota bacterium]